MKNLTRVALALSPLLILSFLAGCSGNQASVDVPTEGRVERKPYESMTVEEKIEFVNKTPMPQEAKDKEIARIKAGGK